MSAQPADSPARPHVHLDASTPVVADHSLRAEADHLSVFGDGVWDLKPFAGKTTLAWTRIRFDSVPEQFREPIKRVVWCTLNLETPMELLERTTAVRSRVTARSVMNIFASAVRPFARWLHHEGVMDFASVDAPMLDRYAQFVAAEPTSRENKQMRLFGVTRMWLLAPYLPELDRLPQPPWEREGLDELLGPANWSAENKTIPVHPQTMSPLLVWAIRFVEEMGDDILRASDERDRLNSRIGTTTGTEATSLVRDFFDRHVQSGRPLPASFSRGRSHFSTRYVAGILGVPTASVGPSRPPDHPVAVGTPLDTPVRGCVEGTAWTDCLHYHEVPELRRMLLGACLVVVGYLSGMRGEEVRALERGCCQPVPSQDGQPDSYAIIAKSFKDALDGEGNTIRGGEVRDQPWQVISTVATAIDVLERLHAEDFVFAARPFNAREKDEDKVIPAYYANSLISDFIAYANGLADRLGRPHERVPDDPDGNVTLARFRRTLAWFIYRLPAGRIALGVQYGHLRGYTSDGYGSRVSTGLRDVFPLEEAYAIADTLHDAADRLESGEQVSGPAADRFVAGVRQYAATYEGQYLTPKQAAKLRRNPSLRIYDNGEQMLACCYDATKALCHPENQREPDVTTSPDLTRCVPGCANGARTDSHVDRLKDLQGWHAQQADSELTPKPLRERHRQRVDALQSIVDDHETTRQPLSSLDTPRDHEDRRTDSKQGTPAEGKQ